MDVLKKRKDPKPHSKKDKKLKKLINKSDSDSDESEHELSYYLNDRVKLMKEVLKIIKPKKIKTMAPECIKNLDNEEINSMLLEELLGISNKRLKYIFNGQNLEEDSSSTDPEAEQQPIDVISLDDITDDDFVIDLDSDNDIKKKDKKHVKPKIKEECKRKKIKKEKQDKTDHGKPSRKSKVSGKDKMDEQNLMSVLELLELQARARAIRSQLALENSKKAEEGGKSEATETKIEDENDDAVIIESPKNIEIVITSSESENEDSLKSSREKQKHNSECENNGHIEKENEKNEENREGKKTANGTEKDGTETEGRLETEKSKNDQTLCESGGGTNDSKPSEDKNSLNANKKICNIETIIISPAKSTIVASNSEKSKEAEKTNEKSKNNVTENEKPKNENSKNEESSKTQTYETEVIVADEGEGIVLNMEQSEIDNIISD